MRPRQLIDPLAERLLVLRTVSGTQWLLRGLGAGATFLALVAALGGFGLLAHVGAALLTATVAAGLLVQCRNPDSDVGLLAPSAILLSLLGQDELSFLRAAGVGIALLSAHCAFALSATLPVHGVLAASAWRLTLRALLPVLVLSLLGGLLVLVLSPLVLGPWMLVLGTVALIILSLILLPRSR
ncbi:hypothetical protein CFK38_15285 [Brachybacterium vulturis]|uniref:Uncharacterized protein n=1 Tax=Brachybacterium vulturis TaxID=2017484 RepID=A0A291GR99_9MICO|nr:hypothetical protein [Brachybacterium vulturis]ATG52738.1 hypothetical protein CFK38_15285 [Brachybacterium vulturis]